MTGVQTCALPICFKAASITLFLGRFPAREENVVTRMMIRAFAAALALCGVLPRPAAAVDLALVLLNDVSRSMDEVEYALVKDGYRAAFADPEVIAALVGNGDESGRASVRERGGQDG